MGQKVLIVEDEPGIADTIQYALETDGFETVCLASGLPVIPFLLRESVDIIILDIGLPDINGFELCKEIRKAQAVPIIFLTARANEIDKVVGLEIGGDDYVTKPFSPRELSARVKALLRRTKGLSFPSGSNLTFQIDESRKQITYSGKLLDLSRYEYALLKTFTRRPGHVFSRDQLMDLCWDEPESSLDRTHRGMGYSLKEEP